MSEEKKIIIDEDWKAQVQAEKEAARHDAKPAATAAGPSATVGDVPMPPASLEMLVTTLATEAMLALGQIPHPQSGETVFHPQQAKYLIDTIDVVCDKTKGNITPAETQGIETLLHQLRMAYVQLANRPQSNADETDTKS